jgi:RHH-type rel operon transcriptional repressor/antitoxin RelB
MYSVTLSTAVSSESAHVVIFMNPILDGELSPPVRAISSMQTIQISIFEECYNCIAVPIAMLAIRLPAAIEKRLDRLAKRTGRTKTYYAREAILQHLDDLEDVYLAEKRLADIRSGRTKTIPLEEVVRRYGLED